MAVYTQKNPPHATNRKFVIMPKREPPKKSFWDSQKTMINNPQTDFGTKITVKEDKKTTTSDPKSVDHTQSD